MFRSEPRLRTRSEGLPKKFQNVYKLGQLYIENGVGSEDWHALGAPKDGLMDSSWTTWERTKDELHGKPPYNSGGPFESIKIDRSGCLSGLVLSGTYKTDKAVPFSFGGMTGRLKYVGGFMPPSLSDIGVSSLDIGNQAMVDDLVPDIRTLGSTVWDRLKPRIEQGGLFVALAEARDVPHMLHNTAALFHESWKATGGFTKSRLMQPKFAADQFLNVQFGWIPFLKDVNDLLSNIINFTTKIQRLAQENGQWIRRRAVLVNQSSETPVSSGIGAKLWPIQVLGGVDWSMFYDPTVPYVEPTWQVIDRKTTYSTAVGTFRYWLPEFAGPSDNPFLEKVNAVRRTIDLFGLRASPSNIYKAIPWTWLIDWVTGVGRSIQAVQDETLDSMVAKYMSMSHHVTSTRVLRQVMPFTKENGGMKLVEFSQITDIKQRQMATSPFGFYLDPSALTGRQYAILGALGLSRKRWGRH